MEKECAWAWWYVSNNGYNLQGMRAKADSRGVRQVIRGNSVVMLEVWIPEPALFFSLLQSGNTKDSSWPPKRNLLCYLSESNVVLVASKTSAVTRNP